MKVEYIQGKANIIADFASRMPIGEFAGLVDDDAFDISKDVPPTLHIYTALESWREEYDKRMDAKRCPVCHLAESHETMLLCDMCNDAYHLSCASVTREPRYWYCQAC